MVTALRIAGCLIEDAFRWVCLLLRSKVSVQAENLFLRRQLALYTERGMKPGGIDAATRASLVVLSHLFDWRGALVVVQPATLLRWRRAGWKLLWHAKSRRGRPPIPEELRALIRRMANENFLWGEERIANELLLKLGIRVSPRTVRKYLPKRTPGQPHRGLRWSTFLKNHAMAVLAGDLCVAIAAKSRMLTSRTSAERRWKIFAWGLDVLRSCIPSADAVSVRMVGPVRRELLDAAPMPDVHSRTIPRRLMTCSGSTRRRGSPSPHVRDPPRSPARVSKVSFAGFTPTSVCGSKGLACADRCPMDLQHAYPLACAVERSGRRSRSRLGAPARSCRDAIACISIPDGFCADDSPSMKVATLHVPPAPTDSRIG
ncbi:helix-turn-helix domain-containing protein [Variovorax sp. J22R115]|uniref:helix-turn-helix domain-containing protein n=1 Tax=Variovorax sp. J22R115 TaxID=3053509 RepID=UPI002574FA68|nr:helix-turn-helix domain-containing protein [Variovorax sp. J22R115]MDM0053793.1 helix-turn-helix domain-containing protein [Variovorax sp. J22R115]